MWQAAKDLVFGDTAIAELFGLDPDKVLKGLPLENYMEKVHPDDRTRLARNISKAVGDGSPYNVDYRLRDDNGVVQLVTAMDKCFRSSDGKPADYAGIVYPVALL